MGASSGVSAGERKLGLIVLLVIAGFGLLFAVAGAVVVGFGAFLVFLGLTLLVLGIGAVIVGRPGWALIATRKAGAAVLAVGIAMTIVGATVGAPAQVVTDPAVTQEAVKESAGESSTPSSSAIATAQVVATSPAITASPVATSNQALIDPQVEADRQAAEAAAAAQAEADRQAAEAAAAAQAEADRQAAEAAQTEARAQVDQPAGSSSGGTVTAGAFCSTVGSTGVTVKGTPMVCSVKVGDSRARWRSAG